MNKEKLIKNIEDQIKEAQIKLGYVKETVRLYYPTASLNGILGTEVKNEQEMLELLRGEFSCEKTRLGILHAAVHSGRIEISVPPEGAEYVHEKVESPFFLTKLIELFQTRHCCTMEEIHQVFAECSDAYQCEKMPEGTDFDYVMYFDDPAVDEYYYCIKAEMGHTIYHRFTKEDYRLLMEA